MNLLLFAQVALSDTTAVADAATQPVKELNYLELAMKGGWIMIPLLLLSMAAVYIFVERFMALRKAANEDANFMNRIKDYIHDGKIESAVNLCQSANTPLARMIEKGISRLGRPLSDVNTAIENAGNLEITQLEKGLPVLASVAGGAPMIGFLGTVIGMIQSFFQMSNAGNNIEVSSLAGGIYTALVTTVAGLMVGIVAYFAYNLLVTKVEKVVFNLEARTMEFMDILNEPVK
ncbi:MAG: MotA/TolQ/ExbB proton channel family protein [Marinilabiliaceae bacterium]|nr:MotA/TolQ/ExbB proton channel family protein [Marinilabiliaceae bacterium]